MFEFSMPASGKEGGKYHTRRCADERDSNLGEKLFNA